MRTCHVRGRAFCFSTLAETYKLWPTVGRQKRISAWLLCRCTPALYNCSLKVWETPNGLYSFLKLQRCCLSVGHEWQPSSRRADFKGTCMGCLLGVEHTCTCSYLWNASSEFILFPFPFLELNRSSTAPFYINHHIANAGREKASAVVPPWLKVETAFMPPLFR